MDLGYVQAMSTHEPSTFSEAAHHAGAAAVVTLGDFGPGFTSLPVAALAGVVEVHRHLLGDALRCLGERQLHHKLVDREKDKRRIIMSLVAIFDYSYSSTSNVELHVIVPMCILFIVCTLSSVQYLVNTVLYTHIYTV